MKTTSFCLLASGILTGCATGGLTYRAPIGSATFESTKEVAKGREEVWTALVPQLGKQFFVINNMDKSSGLINVSYSGDPEKYINCGWLSSQVNNARGERTYGFPGSRAQMRYEQINQSLYYAVDRRMNLDGRMNIVLEEAAPNKTKVSVNTRYVVRRDLEITDVQGRRANRSDTVTFNGGQLGQFARDGSNEGTDCIATGALEKEVLDLVR